VGDGARLGEGFADEEPAGAGLDGDVDLLAGEAPDPAAGGFAGARDAPAAELARLPVEGVEGDLLSVYVESGYDRY